MKDLPALVDGVSTASDGGFWIAMPAPAEALLVTAFKIPYLRWLFAWLPAQVSHPKPMGLVLKASIMLQ